VAFERSSAVIVGDSPSDVETGTKGGATVIGVASGKSSAEELRELMKDSLEGWTDDMLELLFAEP